MDRNQNKRRAASYLLCFTMACTLVLGITYARYRSSVTGTGKASVARVALDSKADLSSILQRMTPGDSRNIDISVSNVKDGRTSEVTQDYSIIINTTGNLPLVYELAQKNSTGAGTYVTTSTIPKSDGNSRAWSGGQMPHSENTVDEYTLTVKWPTNSTDASYADEIDKVTLTVDSKQTQNK